MFKFRKKRKTNIESKLSKVDQSIVAVNAYLIVLENENNANDTLGVLKCKYPKIYFEEATLNDVILFADEYGVTLDYMLGRTDTPYYTL